MVTFENINNWELITNKGRVLCLDYGNKRTGVAISDQIWSIATPLTVLDTANVCNGILNILKDYKVSLIVVGMPLALNGGMDGKQLKIVEKFTEKLQDFLNKNNFAIKIIMHDERLSSVVANRVLSEADFTIKKRKKNVDKIAACFVLQGFLDKVRYKLYGN